MIKIFKKKKEEEEEEEEEEDLGRHQTLLMGILLCVVSTCTEAHTLWLGSVFIVSQLVNWPHT